MSNQRMLAITQLQLDKKRNLAVLSRVPCANFNREQERRIAIKSEQQQQQQQKLLLTRAHQESQYSVNEGQRLLAAQSLRALKHREQRIMSRSEPKNSPSQPNDEFEISRFWWITPSAKIFNKPSNELAKSSAHQSF